MLKLGILFGGRSGEHEISLMSATSVINAINKDKFEIVCIGITKAGNWLLFDGPYDLIEDGRWQEYAEAALAKDPAKYSFTILGAGGNSLKSLIDFALPILHGPYGEDGTVQGIFEIADIPYGGAGVMGSAAAMDKGIAKDLFAKAGLPICQSMVVFSEELDYEMIRVIERIENTLPYPVFVKPANMGSSVGITKARNDEELEEALEKAQFFDRRIIVEEGINCRELETAILGNYNPKAATVGEIIASNEFYDYAAKYFDGGKSEICVPAQISPSISDEIRRIAIRAYEVLDCAGYARVDFFLEKDTDRIYLNEINTIPGFTKYSMFPLLWADAGVSYEGLIERIIELGYERYNAKNNR